MNKEVKPLYRQILTTPESSFTLREFKIPYFDVPWHSHPELEIILVKHSSGTRYAGDHVAPFKAGDLALLGPHLPHCWLNDKLANCTGKDFGTHYVVVQFKADFLGNEFFSMPEIAGIQHLLDRAARGLLFSGESRAIISREIMKLFGLSPLERLIKLLDIFRLMSQCQDVEPLSSPGFVQLPHIGQNSTIDKVHQYVMKNFKQQITLDEMAELTSLTTTSFCRYFKRVMKKTFFTYLKEFRVGYACRLLKETSFSVAQTGYEAGYNNLSLYYRHFREIKGTTPLHYRAENHL